MKEDNRKFHLAISNHLEDQKREFVTDSFAYASYTSPNTMFQFNNKLPDLLLTLPSPTVRVYLKCLSLMKRNHDPVMACTIAVSHEKFKDVVARTTYYKAMTELRKHKLIIPTTKPSIVIVAVNYANKLFKPKVEI